MKKIFTFLLLGFSLFFYSQENDKLNKKELRIAYEDLKLSKQNLKDSLLIKLNEAKLIIKNQGDTLKIEREILSLQQTKIKGFEKRLKELENTIKKKDEEINKLSIKPIKIDYFSEIPKEFEKDCSMIYSENKESFKIKKYVLFEDKDRKIILFQIENKLIQLQFDEEKSNNNQFDEVYYSNNQLTLKISELLPIGGDETTFIYKAKITLTDNNGQTLTFNVYGEGGC